MLRRENCNDFKDIFLLQFDILSKNKIQKPCSNSQRCWKGLINEKGDLRRSLPERAVPGHS